MLGDLADDLARLLDHLGLERAAYAGLSLGGMVGMRFALRHPERVAALALLNTSAEPEDPTTQKMYHQSNESSRTAASGSPGGKAMAHFMMSLMFSDGFVADNPEQIAPYRARLLEPTDREGLYRVAKAVIWREGILDDLSRLTMPSVVITSSADRAIAPARGKALAQALDTELIEIEGAGHMTAVERPAEVNAALEQLLERGTA
jgi:pimeloyl-ACP methyl ester carboxylesterase